MCLVSRSGFPEEAAEVIVVGFVLEACRVLEARRPRLFGEGLKASQA